MGLGYGTRELGEPGCSREQPMRLPDVFRLPSRAREGAHMEQAVITTDKKVAVLSRVVFSAYVPLVFIWANAQRAPTPWIIRFQSQLQPAHTPHSFLDPGFLLSMHVLWALAALVLFALVYFLSRISPTAESVYQAISGGVAVAGFPAAFLFAHRGSERTSDLIEAAIALACALTYAVGRWRIPALWSALLFTLHFALWTLYAFNEGPGYALEWFGLWAIPFARSHTQLAYPLLGFVLGLIWIWNLRQSKRTDPS